MKSFRFILLAFFCLSTMIACNEGSVVDKEKPRQPSELATPEGENKFDPKQDQISDTTRGVPQKTVSRSGITGEAQQKLDWDKKIIKTASINLEVKNYKSFNDQLHSNVNRYGGYIAQEEQSQNDYKIENTISIKVPAEQFDDLVNAIATGDQKLTEKKITSEDVTTEVVDTKSRLEAKKQVRLKYLDLLKEAKNMEGILQVQSEINGIQEEIEAAAGRIEYLSHAAAYSTINLTYSQVLNAAAKDDNEISYGTKAWQSFKNGWTWIADVLVGLISIWPLFLLGFACWVVFRKWLNPKVQRKNA